MSDLNDLLKVVACPMPIVWADVEKNLQFIRRVVDTLPEDIDVLVLPELCSTGFIQDEELLAEIGADAMSATFDEIARMAAQSNIAIAGSCLVAEGGKYYNRGFFIEPSGVRTYYDKRHLFSLSAESGIYTRGNALPPVVNFRGWNISMIVCYDLRFPVWCRNSGHRYDVLLVPANWATARGYAFKHLLIGRAIENQAYVVGCNRGGSDDYGVYADESYIFNPFGYEMAPVDTTSTKGVVAASHELHPHSKAGGTFQIEGVTMLYALFSKSQLQKTRDYLPAGRDADSFVVNI